MLTVIFCVVSVLHCTCSNLWYPYIKQTFVSDHENWETENKKNQAYKL